MNNFNIGSSKSSAQRRGKVLFCVKISNINRNWENLLQIFKKVKRKEQKSYCTCTRRKRGKKPRNQSTEKRKNKENRTVGKRKEERRRLRLRNGKLQMLGHLEKGVNFCSLFRTLHRKYCLSSTHFFLQFPYFSTWFFNVSDNRIIFKTTAIFKMMQRKAILK